jgi:hypothetical protein
LTNPAWLLGSQNQSMVIPPKSQASFAVEQTLSEIAEYGLNILGLDQELRTLEVHSANIHMHSFGDSAFVTLREEDGEEEVLLKISHWDIHWQRDFQFEEAKIIPASDLHKWSNRIECTFFNTTEHNVYGGFGSLDEMCFNFGFFALDLRN